MLSIPVRNVHEALPAGLAALMKDGEERQSRNGPVLVFPTPVTTVYEYPDERVIFWPGRDANPFFHLHEAIWMTGGRNDLKSVTRFVKRMASFSDDGKTLHGAYGHRWRRHFGADQLKIIIETLRGNHEDRRCVLGMWDPVVDLGRKGRDVPCNTQAYFSVSAEGCLDMTVCNRSNDLVLGAYGANAVHFSFLQEFVAIAVGVELGRYYQMSNNLHAYLDNLGQVEHLAKLAPNAVTSPYAQGEVATYPIMSTPYEQWLQDLDIFLDEGPIVGLRDPFFRQVATPMWHAHEAFLKKGDSERFATALEILEQCKAADWRKAATEWITRRRDAADRKKEAA